MSHMLVGLDLDLDLTIKILKLSYCILNPALPLTTSWREVAVDITILTRPCLCNLNTQTMDILELFRLLTHI